jgi:hypothetical protein
MSVLWAALADKHTGGSHTLYLVIGVVAILGTLAVVVINCLKGKVWTAIGTLFLGVIGWVCGIVGASRLAKPSSWWARRFYDESQLARSRNAFDQAPTPGEQGNTRRYECGLCGEQLEDRQFAEDHLARKHGVSAQDADEFLTELPIS